MAKDLLKGINKEILTLGLLIISIGIQIMPLDVIMVERVAGAIIAIIGVLVVLSAVEKTNKKA